MRTLAALMPSMVLLTTGVFTRALVTAQQQPLAQPTVAGVVPNG
jgi:hypothetical protein